MVAFPVVVVDSATARRRDASQMSAGLTIPSPRPQHGVLSINLNDQQVPDIERSAYRADTAATLCLGLRHRYGHCRIAGSVRTRMEVRSRVHASACCAIAASPDDATNGITPTDIAGGAGGALLREFHHKKVEPPMTSAMTPTAAAIEVFFVSGNRCRAVDATDPIREDAPAA